MSKPIRPEECSEVVAFPPEVFDAFNHLISTNLRGGTATFKLTAAVAEIASRLNISRSEVFNRKLCDVEEAYREAGWEVEYDQPAWCESYEAKFTFKK